MLLTDENLEELRQQAMNINTANVDIDCGCAIGCIRFACLVLDALARLEAAERHHARSIAAIVKEVGCGDCPEALLQAIANLKSDRDKAFAAGRAAMREEAAKVADDAAKSTLTSDYSRGYRDACNFVAAAIRSLP